MPDRVVTLSQFVLQQEREHPEASGEFTSVLLDIALAAKMINQAVSRAGLVDVTGETGDINVQGERVQKLDVFAHETIMRVLGSTGQLAVIASEEDEDIVPIEHLEHHPGEPGPPCGFDPGREARNELTARRYPRLSRSREPHLESD